MAISGYDAARAAYNGMGGKIKKTYPSTVQAMTANTATTTPPAWAVSVQKSVPAALRASALAPRAPSNNTGGNGGSSYHSTGTSSGSGGGTVAGTAGGDAVVAQSAPVNNQAMLDEAAKADPNYIDTVSTNLAEYKRLVAQLSQQNDNRLLDYKKTAENLGYVDPDGYGGAAGTWNENDKLTGYGNAFQNQMSDFASRGMLKSSAYGEAAGDLNRGFTQQLSDLASGVATFQQGQKTDTTNAKASQEAADTAAWRQAVALVSAKLGLG